MSRRDLLPAANQILNEVDVENGADVELALIERSEFQGRVRRMVERLGVIFDVNGVLVDSYQAHFLSWQQLAAEIGRLYLEADFIRGFGRTTRENIVEQWTDRTWTTEEIRQLDDRKEWLFREILRDQFPAMDGAATLIQSLDRAGFGIAVGSSGPPENVDLVLDNLGVSPLIVCRITARQVTHGKPNPQVFQLAAEGLSLAPSMCCVIEDAPVGIQAAHAAGIVCIGLASTGRSHPELQTAEKTVDSLRELTPDIIRQVIADGLR
jgi:beta-phosphoglucomutase